MKRAICIKIGILFLWSNILLGQEMTVDARLNTNQILVGDQVELRLGLSYPPNIRLQSIALEAIQTAPGIEVLEIQPADTASVRPLYNVEQKILLTSFDSGVHYIPPISIQYFENGTLKTTQSNQLQLVAATIPVMVSDSTDIQPIKGIIKEPLKFQDFLPYLLVLIGLGAIIVGLVYYLRKRNRPKEVSAPIIIPPKAHELAFQKLEDLKNSNLLSEKAFKAYQSELTYILREYLENRYQVAALESTTPEILKALKNKEFPESWGDRLFTMLQKADLVKFAKATFPLAFHEDSIVLVSELVEETQERVQVLIEEENQTEVEPENEEE